MSHWERLFYAISIALLLSFSHAALSQVASAQENYCGDGVCDPGEQDTCREDCPPASTCGNGICSAFEDYQNCFLDCLPPSLTPTSTPTPTATNVPPSPTVTASLTEVTVSPVQNTPTPTFEPTLATSTPTAQPTIMQVAGKSTPVPGCREVPIEEISEEVATAASGNLTDRWVICDTPPTEMCLAASPDLTETQGDLSLLDCHQTGQCDVYNAVKREDGRICLVDDLPDCSEGCAWAVVDVPEQDLFGLPHPVSLVLMISGLMGLILILHVVYPVPVDEKRNSSDTAHSP